MVSWRTPDGEENIYLSPQTAASSPQPIRGGIPLCFPQFGKGVDREGNNPGPLPSHGFARNSTWRVIETGPAEGASDSDNASVALTVQLTHTDIEPCRDWNHEFDLRVKYTLDARSLRLHATLGPVQEPLSFCFLFHSYFRVRDINTVCITGLQRLVYRDATETPNLMKTEHRDSVWINGPTDSVYLDGAAGRRLQLVDSSAPGRTLAISSAELPDCVVWNPWAQGARTMADLPDSAYSRFICVENGRTTPQRLDAGQGWTASCTFEVVTTGKL